MVQNPDSYAEGPNSKEGNGNIADYPGQFEPVRRQNGERLVSEEDGADLGWFEPKGKRENGQETHAVLIFGDSVFIFPNWEHSIEQLLFYL